jgi:hypothetical protein
MVLGFLMSRCGEPVDRSSLNTHRRFTENDYPDFGDPLAVEFQ